MTREQAKAMYEMFAAIGGCSRIDIKQGSEFDERDAPTWHVELWSINPRTGNRSVTIVRTPAEAADLTAAKRLIREARGEATARDRATLARIRAEREMNAE